MRATTYHIQLSSCLILHTHPLHLLLSRLEYLRVQLPSMALMCTAGISGLNCNFNGGITSMPCNCLATNTAIDLSFFKMRNSFRANQSGASHELSRTSFSKDTSCCSCVHGDITSGLSCNMLCNVMTLSTIRVMINIAFIDFSCVLPLTPC